MNNCSKVIVFVFILLIINEITTSPPPSASCGPDYGQRPCVFVPAKPGNTPNCANPGSTFCEKIKDYPETVIKTLFTKYKIKDILADETQTDFHSLKQQPHGYDHYGSSGQPYNYNSYNEYTTKSPDYYPQNNQNHITNNNYYGQSSQLQSSLSNQQSHQIPYYSNANQNHQNHHNHQEPSQTNKGSGYHYNAPHSTAQQSNFFHTKPSNGYQDYYRSSGDRRKRFYNPTSNEQILQQQFIKSIAPNHRTKRQSPMREQLCETKSNYINPQAALNARGNWMYIVNGIDSATQLVKTETCASQQCSNLCQLPNGYNSRCEQRYVQKRLVALDPKGDKFYTDTFWFPSCCVCTLSNF